MRPVVASSRSSRRGFFINSTPIFVEKIVNDKHMNVNISFTIAPSNTLPTHPIHTVTRFFSPPETPLIIALPTMVSARWVSPKICKTKSTCDDTSELTGRYSVESLEKERREKKNVQPIKQDDRKTFGIGSVRVRI